MGGFGSGERRKKKTTVERCLKLDASRLVQSGVTQPQTFTVGDLAWTNSFGEQILTVRYWSENTAEKTVLHLTVGLRADGRERQFNEAVVLTSTIPNFGGTRWWFLCPLIEDGVACKRRVKKLFLPPGRVYFGCRTCYGLTYESAQSHDARVDRLMKNPWALVNAVKSKDPNLSLRGIQAYFKLCGAL